MLALLGTPCFFRTQSAGQTLLFVLGTARSGAFRVLPASGSWAVWRGLCRLQRRFGACFGDRFIFRAKSFILRAKLWRWALFFKKYILQTSTVALAQNFFSKKWKKVCAGHFFSGQNSLPTGEGAVFFGSFRRDKGFSGSWMLPNVTR